MNQWKLGLGVVAALGCGVGALAASAQQLNPQQVQLIKDTAASICNTVKEAKGEKSDLQMQGEIKAQLNGLIGKVVDLGGSGRGSFTREEFEGLSRDATATALEGDRGCRERVFNKMFDKLSLVEPSPAAAVGSNQPIFIYNGPNSDIEGSTFSGIDIREASNYYTTKELTRTTL
jgi:hypothetical protein